LEVDWTWGSGGGGKGGGGKGGGAAEVLAVITDVGLGCGVTCGMVDGADSGRWCDAGERDRVTSLDDGVGCKYRDRFGGG
jgi:hypothetical protein